VHTKEGADRSATCPVHAPSGVCFLEPKEFFELYSSTLLLVAKLGLALNSAPLSFFLACGVQSKEHTYVHNKEQQHNMISILQ